MTALSDTAQVALLFIGTAVAWGLWCVAVIWLERRKLRRQREFDAVHRAEMERRRAENTARHGGFNPNHDRETDDKLKCNGAREHLPPVMVPISTAEVGKVFGRKRSTRFHSGPRNDHEL